MGCSSSKQSSHAPPAGRARSNISAPRPVPPPKDDREQNPIRPGGPLINGWKPWGDKQCPEGPLTFAGCNNPQVLTQLCILDHMYTYGLMSWADYVRKALGLTRSHEFMRSWFTPDAALCHARLETGKRWARLTMKNSFDYGVLAFYQDPMYGRNCNWAKVAFVLLPLIGKNPHNLKGFQPHRPGSQLFPSAAEFANVKF